jgi:hypothetical protein
MPQELKVALGSRHRIKLQDAETLAKISFSLDRRNREAIEVYLRPDNISKEDGLQLRRLVTGFPPRRPGFDPRSGHLRFVLDKVSLGQVFSEYFGFPCQFCFHRLLHSHDLSSEAGTEAN